MQFFSNLQFMLRKNKQLVGKDILGNRYYNSLTKTGEKRWVIYNGKADPTKVPALWHIWLHYTDNQLPISQTQNSHMPNLTGTKYAYHPQKFFK
ncbi:NADH:ubiquinone oxidoreductase [Ehrlichia ruminantium]|uniref:NADH:ubiquinone oxidoreductase n=1 Tax=Ehrlichia ruminantium TaxID=779 RepID=A0AAE6UI65_EHRRU|nr:NADH-ubiquinone oxidoreductase subunit NDUFA12 family protein [Ehrlichia ruminantium]QGR02212.1 NADH:ubiquinone oxidoreductase [Ehrlichia ruminantium]QGR03134.1 NADH:ubiquinone oxidoreductase [Ehrlichia ruminantium]QGR04059.1 NADH:ubiquinone oxidoreductase [Ehrlichia ruminantium]